MKKIIVALFLSFATSMNVFAMSYQDASTQGKPVVVMFHMRGCSACRKFSSRFDKIAAKFSNKFNFVKEDANSSTIATNLDFPTVPALFIIEPSTSKATRIQDGCAWDNGCFEKTLNEYK